MRVEAGRGWKTLRECVKDDTKELSLHPEWAVFRDMWRENIGKISGKKQENIGKNV